MATVISTINLKGGVAKTTTTVAMAEILSAEFNQRVLVIDLDPQTNATVMLIGEDRWRQLNNEGHTLAQLFRDALEEDLDKRRFNIAEAIVRGVSNVSDVRTVDLLPSSIDLIDVQDRLASMPQGQFFSNVPTGNSPQGNIADSGHIRLCAYRLPSEPRHHHAKRPANFLRVHHSDNPRCPVHLWHSTDYSPCVCFFQQHWGRNRSDGHRYNQIQGPSQPCTRTLSEHCAEITFRSIKISSLSGQALAGSAEFTPLSTLRQKYGYQGEFESYRNLTQEIMSKSLVRV